MYQKTVLPNGLRIITSPMPHLHSVSVCIFTGTGSRYETDTEAGVSHFIEHLMFRGTPRRPTSRDISQAIEGVGGILNASTDKELTLYWAKVTEGHFPLALDVLVDMMLNAKLAPEDIEKERQVITEEINMSLDSPAQRVDMLMEELLWPGHPLGRDIAGTKETVSSMSREMIQGYISRHYVPANTVVSIAGNVQHEVAADAVNSLMGDWQSSNKHGGYSAFEEKLVRRLRIEKRDIEEAHLIMALPGVSLFDERRYALDLMNNVLGAGMSSRLFTEVRDRLGLVYSIHSYAEHLLDSGSFAIGAGVEPKNLRAVIQAVTNELAKLKEKVPGWELQKAKEITKGHLILRLEDSRATAGWTGVQETLKGEIRTIDEVLDIIDKLTAVDVRNIANEILIGEKLRLAIVGPVNEDEKLEELLKI